MPRMKRANFGIGDSAGSGGGAGAAERLSSLMESSQRAARAQIVAIEGGGDERDDHPDLANLEKQLNDEVDEDFFDDPRKFHTLHRVIDVLGMQLDQDRVLNLETNPAFKALKDQQTVVEEAIEHLAMIHCADLNGSVVQVGRVARQFHDAVTKVRCIRKQVSVKVLLCLGIFFCCETNLFKLQQLSHNSFSTLSIGSIYYPGQGHSRNSWNCWGRRCYGHISKQRNQEETSRAKPSYCRFCHVLARTMA